jgi:hypothetical protein
VTTSLEDCPNTAPAIHSPAKKLGGVFERREAFITSIGASEPV